VKLALAAAAAVVGATLLDDAAASGPLTHDRSAALYAFAAVVAGVLLTLAPRVGSRAVSLGAGIAAGGALATLVTGLAWNGSGGVPDPLVHGGIAFNLADLAIALGDALLIGGALLHAVRNRGRLRERV
jgi:lipoprotein signal peptidase